MTDRFKFRAGIQFSYYNDDDKEKQIIIRIEPDGISSDGSVGICKPDLCDIIKKYDLSDREYDSLMEDVEGYEVAEDWILTYPEYIEQCTGLKDKNGELIYEGDIVYSPLDRGTKEILFWDDGLASFMAYTRYPDTRYSQRIGDGYFIELGFEIVGNIHENKELLND